MIQKQIFSSSCKSYKKQYGFTLIEVMMAVTLLGIVISFAYPSYQGYIARGKITEGIVALSDFKHRVTSYHSKNGQWPTKYSDMGYPTSYDGRGVPVSSPYFDKVACMRHTLCYVIVAHVKDSVGSTLSIPNNELKNPWPIALISDVDYDFVSWKCSPNVLGGTTPRVPLKYLPSNCRQLY